MSPQGTSCVALEAVSFGNEAVRGGVCVLDKALLVGARGVDRGGLAGGRGLLAAGEDVGGAEEGRKSTNGKLKTWCG